MRRWPPRRNVPAVKITSSSLVGLFRLAGPIVAGIAGVIFLVVGATLVASQTWERVTGTASACQTRIERTGNPPSHRTHTTCELTWRTAAGENHQGTVDFGGNTVSNGQTVQLRVHGDIAAEAVPAWLAWGSLALGLGLAGGGGFWLWRAIGRLKSAGG